jgi:peptidoglycan/xylan/chitin deacetylase (PgdA/CDA1 family)
VAAGNEIGNHTVSHPCSANFEWSRQNALEDYSLDRIENEMRAANQAIEDLLGVQPRSFAYPCGQRFIGKGVRTRSYVPVVASHFLAGRGFWDETENDPIRCDLAQLAAMNMDGSPPDRLRPLIDQAIEEGRWLILAGHDIGDGTRQAVSVSSLNELCRYARDLETELWTDTVSSIAEFLAARRG